MKTANEFREDKIKSLENMQNKLQDELNEYEKYANEHADELAELAGKFTESATIIKKINDFRDKRKAELLKIAPNSTVTNRIKSNNTFKHMEYLRWSFDEEIQKIRNQISMVNENIKKWKTIEPQEIGKLEEYKAMNMNIID